jgi:hypothetical protein
MSFPVTMMTVGMLQNLCALVFLALAVSPFTAPFQTCDAAKAAVAGPVSYENDPGSLVAPLVTKPGCLTVAVAPHAGFVVSQFDPVAFLTPFTPSPSHIRRDSIRPVVLRV